MKYYRTKCKKLSGTNCREVYRKAFVIYKKLKSKSKRRPYVRSAYFRKDKVFLELFWKHLKEKNWRDITRRLKYFSCAIELLKYSTFEPISKQNPNKSSEIFHRFAGITINNEIFFVQIKEDKNHRKWFISLFPIRY